MDPLLHREGRALARFAHLPFDRAHQRRLLAADKRARAAHQADVEGKTGPEDVLAEQPKLPRLAQGDDQMFDRQRILIAGIDDAFRRAGGVGADDHPLQDAVRIALQHAPVHIGAGIPFIGVADQDFPPAVLLLRQEFPLAPGREPRTATAPEAGGLDLVHDLPRISLFKDFCQRGSSRYPGYNYKYGWDRFFRCATESFAAGS